MIRAWIFAGAAGLCAAGLVFAQTPSSGTPTASSTKMTFSQALSEIVRRSTSVETQRLAADGARARNLPQKTFFLPSLTANLSQNTTRDSGQSSVTGWRNEIAADLNLFRFGADIQRFRAAVSDEQSRELAIEDSILAAEEAAVKTLVSVFEAGFQTDIQKSILELRARSLKIADERYRKGLLPRQEVERIAVDVENARSSFSEAEIRRVEAEAELVSALGSAEVTHEWPWKEEISRMDLGTVAVGTDLSRRPDWKSAASRVESEERLQSAAFRSILPTLDATVSFGTNHGLLYAGSPESGWAGSLVLRIPLFERLTSYSAWRAQSFSRASAEISFEQTRRNAERDWRDSHQSLVIAAQSAISREKILETSRRLYEDNFRRFQVGRINANDLAFDQTRIFDAESLAVRGWANAHIQLARYRRAQGCHVSGCQSH